MIRSVTRSVRRKMMLVVLATTFVALAIASAAMIVYEMDNYRQAWANDLLAQAEIVGLASAPALAFGDRRAARENLAVIRARPQVMEAALYAPSGAPFATWVREGASAKLPDLPESDGYRFDGENVRVFKRIVENNEIIGTVYLRARHDLLGLVAGYAGILLAVMLGSLAVAFLLSFWLQSTVTRPILAVADAARQVMLRRDFSVRVRKTSDDEVGVLVDAFNDMLAEAGRRAAALDESHRSLEREMGERRGAEEALRAADRRKDEFLATLAHELRNPLAPIRNALEILRAENKDPAAAETARRIMQRQLAQMVHLVNDLLDVSRITTGKIELQKERIDLAEVIQGAVETARPLVDARRQKLTLRLPDVPVPLFGDRVRLAQVFSNLLHNAAKYTPDGGEIELSARREKDDAVVEIADNGIGIPKEMLSAIFEMFMQVDQSLERAQSGLGVGLTLAKRMVELHAGTIEARSDGPGRGSRFIVRLRMVGEGALDALDAGPTAQGGASSGHRILVVDDNRDFAESIAMILVALGNDVQVAHDGVEALEIAAAFHPDVAFLDIGLPKLNGYQLARRLREWQWTKNVVLVAITGWGQEQDKLRAKDAGFDHHIVKPVQPEWIAQLLAQIRPSQR